MNQFWWWLVEPVSRFLEHDEREAVLGDLAESRQTGPRALLDVLDLVIRRQARLWMGWRPWLILFALILPLGMLLSIASRRTSDGSAVPLWMYANNWDWALTKNPGFWRLMGETGASLFIAYVTLACWSWVAGFVLGSLSRRIGRTNGLLLCLMLFVGEPVGAQRYFAFIDGYLHSVFGVPHLPDYNAAVFEVAFYRVVLPVMVQIVLVAIPALWGLRHAITTEKPGSLLRIVLAIAAIVTLAEMVIQEPGFWFLLGPRAASLQALPAFWNPIRQAQRLLEPIQYWPIVFLIAHAIRKRTLRTAAI